jgi:uncharacterized protein (TIGR03067 family)
MRRTSRIVVALGVLVTASCLLASDDATRKELAQLEGTWRVVASEKDSAEAPPDDIESITISIAGVTYTVRREGEVVEEGTIRIDPTRMPRSIDASPSKPECKIRRGIYESREDGTIRICFAHPGQEDRPARFSTTEGTCHTLTTARRIGPK